MVLDGLVLVFPQALSNLVLERDRNLHVLEDRALAREHFVLRDFHRNIRLKQRNPLVLPTFKDGLPNAGVVVEGHVLLDLRTFASERFIEAEVQPAGRVVLRLLAKEPFDLLDDM